MRDQQFQWLFAYGSNMNWKDVLRWLIDHGLPSMHPTETRIATLDNYRLVWNYWSVARRGGAANIERAFGQNLPGVLFRVEHAALLAMDRKEGRTYQRWLHPFHVQGDSKEIVAWVYEVKKEFQRETVVPPTPSYLSTVIHGAQCAGLPASRIDALRRTPVRKS